MALVATKEGRHQRAGFFSAHGQQVHPKQMARKANPIESNIDRR
jgi:hypothetical protein